MVYDIIQICNHMIQIKIQPEQHNGTCVWEHKADSLDVTDLLLIIEGGGVAASVAPNTEIVEFISADAVVY